MTIDNGAEQAIICGTDLVGVSIELTEKIRAKIEKVNTEIDTKKLSLVQYIHILVPDLLEGEQMLRQNILEKQIVFVPCWKKIYLQIKNMLKK